MGTRCRCGGSLIRFPAWATVLLLLLCRAAEPAGAEEEAGLREQRVLDAAPWLGGGGAAVYSTAHFIWQTWWPSEEGGLFIPRSPGWKKAAVAVPATAAYTAAGAWSTAAAARLYTRWEVPPLWSVPAGMVCGAAAGAVTGAAGFTATMAVGKPLGVIDTGTFDSYLSVLGMSVLAGAFWGSFAGALPGFVLGPVVSFYLAY
jgi:hypothetical protein